MEGALPTTKKLPITCGVIIMNMNKPVAPPFGYYGDEEETVQEHETEEDFMLRTGRYPDGRRVSNKDMEYLLYG